MNTQSESKSRVNASGLTIPFSRPWHDRQYADDYERAFRLIRRNREAGNPTRLNQVVEYVYDTDYSNTEYQRIRRFVRDCDYFKTDNSGNYLHIEPTLAVFGLPPESDPNGNNTNDNNPTRHFSKPIVGARASRLESDVSVTQKQQTATGLEKSNSERNISDTDTTESYPKDRVESLLEKILQINADGHADYRHEILTQLGTYRNNISGTYSILEHRVRDQYLGIPNTTRFTDKHDSGKSQRRFRHALDKASEDYSEGVVVTLTLDPKRFSTHTDAIESIRDKKGRLLSRLRYQLGESPTQITIPDFQSKTGLLHYHIVLFGVSKVTARNPLLQNEVGQSTISTSQIEEYWNDDYDMGSQISVQRTRSRGSTWILHRDDKTVSLGYYLGKRIRELQDLAGLDTGSIPLEYWRHALFWTYDLRYCTCSDSLKETTDTTDTGLSGLPKTTEWTYIGTARYEQIPSQIRDKMILVGID